MILTEYVTIKLGAANIGYYISKGYVINSYIDSKKRLKTFKRGQMLTIKVADLHPGSRCTVECKCSVCGIVRKVQYTKWSSICWACNLQKQKGPDHPRYLKSIRSGNHDRKFDILLRKKYNITAEQYYEMFKNQEYKCLICKDSQSNHGRKFCVDHNHITKKVRGILCQPCNTAMGLLKENLHTLKTMIDYIKKDENNG